MKALKEIGFKKAVKFFFTSLALVFYRAMIFPPMRVAFLRLLGAKIGKDCVIHSVNFFNCYRTGFTGFYVGDKCFIGDECLIDLADKVIFEDNVTVSERVTILTHTNVGYRDHPLQKYFTAFCKKVVIRRGAFIGVNATILPGVEVGECAVVGACSLVNKNVSPYTVVGGIPARVIKKLK